MLREGEPEVGVGDEPCSGGKWVRNHLRNHVVSGPTLHEPGPLAPPPLRSLSHLSCLPPRLVTGV